MWTENNTNTIYLPSTDTAQNLTVDYCRTYNFVVNYHPVYIFIRSNTSRTNSFAIIVTARHTNSISLEEMSVTHPPSSVLRYPAMG